MNFSKIALLQMKYFFLCVYHVKKQLIADVRNVLSPPTET